MKITQRLLMLLVLVALCACAAPYQSGDRVKNNLKKMELYEASFKIEKNKNDMYIEVVPKAKPDDADLWSFEWKYQGKLFTSNIAKGNVALVIDDIRTPEFRFVWRSGEDLDRWEPHVLFPENPSDFNPNAAFLFASMLEVKISKTDYDKYVR